MIRRSLSVATFALLAVALSTSAQTVNLSFTIGGKARNAVVYVPSGISNPPVVYFVHGYGGDGAGFANDTKGNKVADREKFIAIYPSAFNKSWNMYDSSDYPFLRALLDTVDRRYKIDKSKVYCTGFSQGGFISNGLGYKYPDMFAAVAPVSGHLPTFATTTRLKRPMPILTKFGTGDVSDVASFMKDIDLWLKLDSCSASNRKVERPYPVDRKTSKISRTTYTCAQGVEVAYDSVIGGGHTWAMDTVNNTNTTEEVWEFFRKYSLNSSTGIVTRDVPGAKPRAVFRGDRVVVQGIDDGRRVRITSIRGELVAASEVTDGSFAFAAMPHGVYFVHASGRDGFRAVMFTVP